MLVALLREEIFVAAAFEVLTVMLVNLSATSALINAVSFSTKKIGYLVGFYGGQKNFTRTLVIYS